MPQVTHPQKAREWLAEQAAASMVQPTPVGLSHRLVLGIRCALADHRSGERTLDVYGLEVLDASIKDECINLAH